MKLKKLMRHIEYKTPVKIVGMWYYDSYGSKEFGETIFEDTAAEFFDGVDIAYLYEGYAELRVQNVRLDSNGSVLIVEVSG